ncbi:MULTISPECIES: transposase [unclassified Coleofasciculus]|uniref:transposase n=1 Tax=unclassified Coleofasciculus TaxID=2692782 RepID=UPI00187F3985|nr:MULTISPECIES: transposase [unclassified Coleofasciculus]MBE9130285.1 transposase [Coleofasciculus sp. LEGE 07081]MBE9147293.1 transposase [Coleofasciculus sp. LEGE 07092]
MTQLTEKPALTDEETLEEVLDCLTEHISVDTQGAFDQRDLFQILVRAASNKDSLETYLLAELSALKIKIKTLYLDRGFFSVPVIRWLKALKIPFIMPAIRRGKTGGIKQYLKGRSSYKTNHTMSRGQDESVTFDLWIVCKYRKGQRGKQGLEYFAYVVYQASISLTYIHEDYRKRFGIESSYRLKNICRIKTTNKKPALRLFFVCLSFLLVNIWVNLLWRRISRPRKGGRLVYRELLTFKQMLLFLCQAVERIYQVVQAIYLPAG